MVKPQKSDAGMDETMKEVDQQMKLDEFSNEVFESTVEAAKELSAIYRPLQNLEKAEELESGKE